MEVALKKYFGYSAFRRCQKEVIEKILQGRDCLVVMATGSGKSLCYQVPPLIARKTAVVISPLLSLMQDQVMALRQRGIKAEHLSSAQTDSSVQRNAQSGQFDILYMTPEKACSISSSFWLNLLNNGICLLAVDEAHCISEWGHDFRVEYKQLDKLRNILTDVPFVGLTATATEKVRSDIMNSLKMRDPYIAVGSFDRNNLFYGVKYFNGSSFVDELVGEVSKCVATAGSTIIYCTTVRDAEQIFKSLLKEGIKAGIYHGQMNNKAREESHSSFVRDELHVMVATIAFGMGIDKPNIRYVIHYGCPKSLESYYQESGRCGRDGIASTCWLYYTRADFAKADFYCREAKSENQRKAIMESFMDARSYCMLTTCRRKYLLDYFGEKYASDNCGTCDNCTTSQKKSDMSREAFLLMACIRSCRGNWGLNMPVDILRGSRSKKILDAQFDKLPFHGLGKELSANWWKALGYQLISHGYLSETVKDVYTFVCVSPKGLQFLSSSKPDHQPALVLPVTSEMSSKDENRNRVGAVGVFNGFAPLEYEGLSEAEVQLYKMLLDERMKLARAIRTAPYAICGDQTLKKIALARPSTKARLANIDGVNQTLFSSSCITHLDMDDLSKLAVSLELEGTKQSLYMGALKSRVAPRKNRHFVLLELLHSKHLLSNYGDHFVQNVQSLSQELKISLDGDASAQNTIMKPFHTIPNPDRKLTPSKIETWRMWQEDGVSVKKIANFPGRSAPIKEETVQQYILDAAQEGRPVDWTRFSQEIGLTSEIFANIQGAISKVGSRDRLKPIKNELPEEISYMHIKACLKMQDLGMSAEVIASGQHLCQAEQHSIETSDLLAKSGCPCHMEEEPCESNIPVGTMVGEYSSDKSKEADSNSPANNTSPKQPTVSIDDMPSPNKRQKVSESLLALEATESSLLNWLKNYDDGVCLSDILEHFNGSTGELVLELLSCLEGEFLIFKKNGLYRLM